MSKARWKGRELEQCSYRNPDGTYRCWRSTVADGRCIVHTEDTFLQAVYVAIHGEDEWFKNDWARAGERLGAMR